MKNTTTGRRHYSKSERPVSSTCVLLPSSFALTICTLLRDTESKFKERNWIWYCRYSPLPLANQPAPKPWFFAASHSRCSSWDAHRPGGGRLHCVLKAEVVMVSLKDLGNLNREEASLYWMRLSQARRGRWREGLQFCRSLKKKWCLIHHERSQDLQCLTGNTEILNAEILKFVLKVNMEMWD